MLTPLAANREKLLEGLRKSVEEVMMTMAWSDVTFCGANQSPTFTIANEILGLIRLYGYHDGMVGVATDISLAKELVGRIIGLAPEELTQEDLLDGISELANMICGGMKTKAQLSEIKLSPPVAVVGSDFVAQWKTDHPTIILNFQVGDRLLRVHACV